MVKDGAMSLHVQTVRSGVTLSTILLHIASLFLIINGQCGYSSAYIELHFYYGRITNNWFKHILIWSYTILIWHEHL